ncbi:MAG: hypothetical protein QOI82_1484 [Actinomycetota bacterium]|nr:hypothetical protein [Actinomycetota bacterium]
MTTPEDRLRQILLAEAEDITPAGDGLQRIQQRLVDRRSLRSKLIPAMAIAGVVAIAGAAAVTVSLTDEDSLKQRTDQRSHERVPSPQPSSCTAGLCEEPKPSPSLSTTGVTTSASGIPLWPITSDVQADDWAHLSNPPRWEGDAVQVTQHLLDDYLKLPGKAMPRTDDNEDVAVVDVSAGQRTVSQLRLVRVGRDPAGPWSVVSATAVSLAVTKPGDGDVVSAPISIVGTAADPDTSVHLRLMTDMLLGEGFAMAGRDIPWTHSLPLTDTSWSVAALVANTFDGKGDLHAVTITAVQHAGSGAGSSGASAPGSTFVAVEGGNVVAVDALSGTTLRQISFPSAGTTDSSPDRGGANEVVWVRTEPDHCTSEIILATVTRGTAGTAVLAKPVRRDLASLSAGGKSLGWVEFSCAGGPAGAVVVRGPDGNISTRAKTAEPVTQLDVRDDGWAVLQMGDRVVVLPSGATDVAAGKQLVGDAGCQLATPAWDGTTVVAWENCGQSWYLVRWPPTGARTHDAAQAGMSDVTETSVEAGHVLVWLADLRIARLTPTGLAEVVGAARWSQPDW